CATGCATREPVLTPYPFRAIMMLPLCRRLAILPALILLPGVFCFLVVGQARLSAIAKPPTPLRLDLADDGKQLKLLVRHPEIGLVCELHCYEAGPFHYGKGATREDGSVVLTHTSGGMSCTTTFTTLGEDRVSMDVLVQGPNEELKQILFIGP